MGALTVTHAQRILCRLCGGNAKNVFSVMYLGKYQVKLYRCDSCQSLQTEKPYWLEEAYAEGPVHKNDPDYLRRGLQVYAMAKMLRLLLRIRLDEIILDYGGGIGIVPRLLADDGITARNFDAYTKTVFGETLDFTNFSDSQAVGLVILSEVLEHLPSPAKDLETVFRLRPRYIYAGTTIYSGEGPDWHYLAAETGQHVFFYSKMGIAKLAKAWGYTAYTYGDRTVLARNTLSAAARLALFFLIRTKFDKTRLLWALATGQS